MNIDQTLVNSLHGLLDCEIGGLDWHVITRQYITHVKFIQVREDGGFVVMSDVL